MDIFDDEFQKNLRNSTINNLIIANPFYNQTDCGFRLLINGGYPGTTVFQISKDVDNKLSTEYKISHRTGIYILKTCNVNTNMSLTLEDNKPHRLGLDSFTNELFIGYILRNVFETNRMKSLAVSFIGGSIDNSNGYIMTEYVPMCNICDIPRLREYILKDEIINNHIAVRPRIIEAIISQVLTTLHFLDLAVEFSIGNINIENIMVYDQKMRGIYLGLNLSAPFTCKMSNFNESSLTIRKLNGDNMRIYNCKNKHINVCININKTCDNSCYIIPNDFDIHTYHYLRSNSLVKSLDYYIFILQILSMREYYHGFFNNKDIVEKFWTPMWIEETDSIVCRKLIYEFVVKGSRMNTTDALIILQGKRIRCNIIDNIVRG